MRPIRAQPHGCLDMVQHVVQRKAVTLHTHGIDTGIRSDAARHFHQRFTDLDLFIVDDLRALRLG